MPNPTVFVEISVRVFYGTKIDGVDIAPKCSWVCDTDNLPTQESIAGVVEKLSILPAEMLPGDMAADIRPLTLDEVNAYREDEKNPVLIIAEDDDEG